jgi:phospholipid/cholesterol/gamma-HCH transport system substrate-binding protein
MKIKFNKFERVAGLFVGLAILGTILTAISVAVKQGWFETKVSYYTYFQNADGLHQGTLVQISGLRAGAVEDIELQTNNKVLVRFYVLGKFQDRLRNDSQVQLIRPFLIGEKVLDVTVGSAEVPAIVANSEIKSIETMDLMSLMSGKHLNGFLLNISTLLENVKVLAHSFLDKDRTQSMVKMVDEVFPLVKNLNSMSVEVIKLSKQINGNNNLQLIVNNLAITTNEINKILPELNKQNPELAQNLAAMTKNISQLTNDRRLTEALNETVVVLKAMQKSFFMRSNVQEVKKEESEQQRKPASPAQ